MNRLTFNIFLSLIIQSKITGKGKIGNGKLLIQLLSVIAGCENFNMTKERNLLGLFSQHSEKQSAHRQINRFLFNFVPHGTGFPSDKITMHNFEKNVNFMRKTNWERYRFYLAEMGSFCANVINKEKAPALVDTLKQFVSKHYF